MPVGIRHEKLVMAFNNTDLTEEAFEQMLSASPQESKAFTRLGRKIGRL